MAHKLPNKLRFFAGPVISTGPFWPAGPKNIFGLVRLLEKLRRSCSQVTIWCYEQNINLDLLEIVAVFSFFIMGHVQDHEAL